MDLSPLSQIIPSFGSPTLEGFDASNIQDGQRLKGDSNRQLVRFYKKKIVVMEADKVRINEKTGETKILSTKPVEYEKEFVEIVTPGDKNVIDDFAQDFHKREHFKHYKAFREGRSAPMGQSIDDCSFISPSVATELKYLGVHTVEQMAEAADILCNNIANGYEVREFARAFCKASLDNKSLGQVNALKGELEKSQTLIAQMQEQMKEMKSMILNPTSSHSEDKRSLGKLKKEENA